MVGTKQIICAWDQRKSQPDVNCCINYLLEVADVKKKHEYYALFKLSISLFDVTVGSL